jgi:hypothetical protein
VPTEIKNSVTVNSLKWPTKIQWIIGCSHKESPDWRKDEVDVLLESKIVSERSQQGCGSGSALI